MKISCEQGQENWGRKNKMNSWNGPTSIFAETIYENISRSTYAFAENRPQVWFQTFRYTLKNENSDHIVNQFINLIT